MAKIKLGAIVVGMSGKLGGHVFATNRGGAYMRTKTSPINPQTSYQTAQRAMFAGISAAWGGLSDANRKSFRDAVASFATTNVFGDLKNPTGKALYQRLNINLENTGQSQLTVAPMPAAVTAADVTSATGAAGTPAFAIAHAGATTGDKVIVYATDKVSNGTKFVKNKLRQIGTYAGQAAGNIDILSDYTARFGALVAADNIYVAVRTVNSVGQASPLQIVKATISA